jgi:hypothetical protein
MRPLSLRLGLWPRSDAYTAALRCLLAHDTHIDTSAPLAPPDSRQSRGSCATGQSRASPGAAGAEWREEASVLLRRSGAAVIARTWRGWASAATADDYQHHYETEVAEHLQQVPASAVPACSAARTATR